MALPPRPDELNTHDARVEFLSPRLAPIKRSGHARNQDENATIAIVPFAKISVTSLLTARRAPDVTFRPARYRTYLVGVRRAATRRSTRPTNRPRRPTCFAQ